MKKSLIVAVAAAVCIGLSGLAMADLKVGGKICFDTYMQSFDDTYMGKSAAAPTITDFSEVGFENNSTTNLNVRWTDGNFGMYLELAMGSSNDQTVLQATRGSVQPVDNVYTRYSYGWWDFGAGKLTVGERHLRELVGLDPRGLPAGDLVVRQRAGVGAVGGRCANGHVDRLAVDDQGERRVVGQDAVRNHPDVRLEVALRIRGVFALVVQPQAQHRPEVRLQAEAKREAHAARGIDVEGAEGRQVGKRSGVDVERDPRLQRGR